MDQCDVGNSPGSFGRLPRCDCCTERLALSCDLDDLLLQNDAANWGWLGRGNCGHCDDHLYLYSRDQEVVDVAAEKV